MKSKETRLINKLLNSNMVLSKVNLTYIVSGTKFDVIAKILLDENITPLSVKQTNHFVSQSPLNLSKYVKSFFEYQSVSKPYFRTFAASIQGLDGSIKLIQNIFDHFSSDEILEKTDICRRGVELSKEQFERVEPQNSLYLNFDEVKMLDQGTNQELIKRITNFFNIKYNSTARFKINLDPYKESFDRYEAYRIKTPEFTYLRFLGVQRQKITANTSLCEDDKPLLFRIN